MGDDDGNFLRGDRSYRRLHYHMNNPDEDFRKGEFESKFQFKINKEKMTSCGCGISFSPK